MLKILKNSRKNESREIYKEYFKKYAIKYNIDEKNGKNEEYKNVKDKNNKKDEKENMEYGKATFDDINNLDGNNSFRFDGKVVKYIKIDSNKIYFKGADVAKALKYSDPDQEIRNKVSEKYKKSFENIKTRINHRTQKTINEKKSTIFITETGLYSLIMKSKNRKAEEFQEFITDVVLPSIRKNGSYIINPDITDYSGYKIEELYKYYDYKVFYIFYIGFINNKHVFKYGITENIYQRFSQHKNDYEEYNNNIYLVYISKCENNREIEKAFSDEIIGANLKLDGKNFSKFKGKKTELATISNHKGIEFLFEKADFLIKNIKSRKMLERDNKEYKNRNKEYVKTIDLLNDRIIKMENELDDCKKYKNNYIRLLENNCVSN
jgi:prophage antirepressor-like protein